LKPILEDYFAAAQSIEKGDTCLEIGSMLDNFTSELCQRSGETGKVVCGNVDRRTGKVFKERVEFIKMARLAIALYSILLFF